MLVLAGLLWQVHKRTSFGFKVLNAAVNVAAVEFVESRNEALDEIELAVRSEFADQ